MESTIRKISHAVYAVIGPEGATNFTIVKGNDGSTALGKSRMVERNINHFLTGKWY